MDLSIKKTQNVVNPDFSSVPEEILPPSTIQQTPSVARDFVTAPRRKLHPSPVTVPQYEEISQDCDPISFDMSNFKVEDDIGNWNVSSLDEFCQELLSSDPLPSKPATSGRGIKMVLTKNFNGKN